MERTHVHFATGLPRGWAVPAELLGAGEAQPAEAETHDGGEEAPPPAGGSSTPPEDEGTAAPAVVSGMRSSSSVLVYLDAGKAMERGLKFWRSENGVVLCDGGEAGLVPLECFRLVEERGAGGSVVLVRDGVVVGKLKGRGS
jgi:2'-phosphotransferase